MLDPRNAKAPGLSAEGLQEFIQSTASLALCTDACNEKLTANLIAAFAVHADNELAGGGFAVTKWGLVKTAPDLRTLIAFGRQVGPTC